MSSLNKVQILGRLGRDPELRYTQGGDPVANFSVACGETWKDKSGEKREKTEWFNVVVWGKLAEVFGKYLAKGALAYFEGKLQTRKWTDKEGVEKKTTEVVAHNMIMLGGKRQSTEGGAGYADSEAAPGPEPSGDPVIGDDEIPF